MKTNVVMKSDDRNLFGIVIKQNTKDGESLSVSDLQQAYNIARYQYGWSLKRIDNVMATKDFQERCFHLLHERGFIKTTIHGFMEMVENEGIVKVLKGLRVWKTSGRGENKSTYCDPYIWVLLAMELNPLIYAKVVIWLTDKLIINRITAGTEFSPMMSKIKEIVPNPRYSDYCKLINQNVFGKHYSGIRDTATQEQLQNLSDVEKFVSQSIDMGVVKNEQQLLYVISKYKIKHSENQQVKKICS